MLLRLQLPSQSADCYCNLRNLQLNLKLAEVGRYVSYTYFAKGTVSVKILACKQIPEDWMRKKLYSIAQHKTIQADQIFYDAIYLDD